ncbi:MAG: hypothetical protein ACTSO2_18870 [Promethearchaeota archaeon]
MAKYKKDEFEEEEEFVSPDFDSFEELKFLKIRKLAYSLSILTIIAYILLKIIFQNDIDIFIQIISWFCLYLWLIPILFFQMRHYKFSLHIRDEEKIAKIYTIYSLYSFFVWLFCLLALIFGRTSVQGWLIPTIELTCYFVLIPGVLLVIIFQR